MNKNCGPDIVKFFSVVSSGSATGSTGDFNVCNGTTFVTKISGCTDNVNFNGNIFNNDGSVIFDSTIQSCSGVYTSNLYGCSPITVHDSLQSNGSSALGTLSLAWGNNVLASASFSHAQGRNTVTMGLGSHAEGERTITYGDYSHAEGYQSLTYGNYSHAEGYQTISSGFTSNTQGRGTITYGDYSYAGGFFSKARGNTSFIHSTNSVVLGSRSVVLGGENLTGSTDDTVYVPYLNINNLLNNQAVNNLGIDSNGNVVVGFSDGIYVTGGTYNQTTDTIILKRNDGVEISITGVTDTFTTGGTYDNTTSLITFEKNDGTNYTVDLSSITVSAGTNTFTTGATLNGNILEFNRTDLNNAYSVDLSPLVFTGNTSGNCISDLYVSNIHSCSPLNINPNDEGNVYFGSTSGVTVDVVNGRIGVGTTKPGSNLDVFSSASSFGDNTVGRVIISDDYYGGELGLITDLDETIAIKYNDGTFRYGGNSPGSEPIVVSGNNVNVSGSLSATTFYGDGSNLSGVENFYTTGATLNGNILEFNRTDLNNAYSVDLSSLDLSVNYSNVVFVDVINGNDITATINDFTKPCFSVSQGISLATALPGLSSTNRALVYIRRGNYINPTMVLQNNVDVYCEPGVVFTNTVQIRDNGVAVNSNIYGKLKINSAGSTIPVDFIGDSFIYFEFDSIVSNSCAIGVNIPTSNNNIRIKGNSIYSNCFAQGFGITIRGASNVTLNISEKIESIHQTLRFRFYTGKTTINCPNIFLLSGNLYGGNWKQVVYLDSPSSTGEVVINGNLVCTDTVNYGGVGSVVRFWDSPNINLKVNGDVVAGVIPGIVLSNGAGKMILNGNISGNQTCISSSGSNKLIINNGGIVRNTDTFASPFSIGGSSEVYINNCYYYSAFYGNMINIDNNNVKLYLNNFISEGFIDVTGTTGTFINVGVTSPTLGLNNVSTNRNYNTNLNTSYLINLNVDSNIVVPKFF